MIVELELVGETGLSEVIETTNNHPFWVEDQGWTRVDQLQAGDQIPSGTGATLVVESVYQTERVETVYNFGVDEFRSYFVGESGAWVHNCFTLPKTVRSPRGVSGKFSKKGYNYRIDTNKGAVAPGEGGFHIHVYRKNTEFAKVNGRGGYAKSHGGKVLKKPSELPKNVRNEVNRLVEHAQKNLD